MNMANFYERRRRAGQGVFLGNWALCRLWTAVGELLAKLGLTPQKPLQRAYQRDPAAIEAWRRDRFPAIARQAKASGGEVYFWDESGFRADTVHGKPGARKVRRLWSDAPASDSRSVRRLR